MPPSRNTDALRRLDALAQVGLRLARQAPSGRILLAQLALGIDEAWIPRPWGDDLLAAMAEARAATADPIPGKRVESTLERAWGAKPRDELDDLELEPVAVTPTSQVHRATLDGDPVAVKLQRPGLARSVRQDLALLDSLVAPLNAALPALDTKSTLREIADRTKDELDLEHEASNARRIHRALKDHPRLVVPAPVTRLSTDDVLVREWIDGESPRSADGAARDAAATDLVTFVLGGAPAGIMNSGLTPADVLVTSDGRTAIVDHGVCCDVDRARIPATLAAATALVDDDPDGLAAALADLGWLPSELAPDALGLLNATLGDLLDPVDVALDVDAVREAGLRLLPHQADAVKIARAGAIPAADLWPLRGALQLFATIARIGATADLAGASLDALEHGWTAND